MQELVSYQLYVIYKRNAILFGLIGGFFLRIKSACTTNPQKHIIKQVFVKKKKSFLNMIEFKYMKIDMQSLNALLLSFFLSRGATDKHQFEIIYIMVVRDFKDHESTNTMKTFERKSTSLATNYLNVLHVKMMISSFDINRIFSKQNFTPNFQIIQFGYIAFKHKSKNFRKGIIK